MKLTPPSSPHVGSGHNVFSTDGSLPQSGAKERYATYNFVQKKNLEFLKKMIKYVCSQLYTGLL